MRDLLGADGARLAGLGIDPVPVERAAVALVSAMRGGGKLLTVGNGGSASDAQHVAAEFVGRFERARPGWPAIALTTDTSALTAIGNDFGFEHVFERQVEALGRSGDVLLAISTSGNSPNIVAALRRAAELKITTIGLCGATDSVLARESRIAICVGGGGPAAIQERHLAVEHALCRAIETAILDDPGSRVPGPGSVVTLESLLELRAGWRAEGRTVVWTNGCFDIFHRGHLHSLEAARALGDVLVVGINDDASARRQKGDGRPLMPERDRAELLAALRVVDYVTVFEEDTPTAVLRAVQPDVHTKGADYAPPAGKPIPEREIVEGYGGRVEFLPLIPGRSTTALVSAIRDGAPLTSASDGTAS